MNRSYYARTLKTVSVMCIVIFLFSSCSSGISRNTVKYKSLEYVSGEYSGDGFNKTHKDNYDPVCKSGLIELLFDKTTMTPAIRDTSSDIIWTSLPDETLSKQISSYAAEVTLSNGDGKLYVLNTQDNSVNWGNASYEISDDGVSVKYAVSADEQTGKADISTLTDKQIRVDFKIIYSLRDGSFYVNISMNTLTLPDGVYLEKIKVLNNFGAYGQSAPDDFIFVPDGSGALIMTGIQDDGFSPLDLSVYGSDKGVDGKSEKSSCLVGAFGIKHGNGAFLCIIEQGDSIAEINALRDSDKSLNSVGATFKTTDIYTDENTKSIKRTYGYTYKNEIRLCYRFLSGRSATYSGMAAACRENLIRNSVLSTKTVDPSSQNIPLVLTLQGGYINEKGKYFALSKFDQVSSLLSLLKAKGVNNIYVRYNGVFGGANNGKYNNFGKLQSGLGKTGNFNSLYSYISSQKFTLFLDTDILTFSYSGSDGAKSLSGSVIKSEPSDSSTALAFTKNQGFAKIKSLEDQVENILSVTEYTNLDGYALNDIGSYLYSDYSSDFYSRESTKKEISAQIPVIATSKKLMIDTGNFYSVKNADIISDIPVSPIAKSESDSYKGIPFIQMMLHGISDYSPSGINSLEDIKKGFLKSVEYGCLPSVFWYCSQYDENLDKLYYYNSNINDIVSFYLKADSVLCELRDARMTAHYEVQKDFYCTEYNNSSKVYVNYSSSPITVNGITVDAEDCITIS